LFLKMRSDLKRIHARRYAAPPGLGSFFVASQWLAPLATNMPLLRSSPIAPDDSLQNKSGPTRLARGMMVVA
jgi:hypothetical protein